MDDDEEDQKEIKANVDILKEIPDLKIKSYKKESFLFSEPIYQNSINDYTSLVSIRTLKQKPDYYLTK